MSKETNTFSFIPLDMIEPDMSQPRNRLVDDQFGGMPLLAPINRSTDDDESESGGPAQSLSDSILSQGVLQPILVEPLGDGRYKIIAGERRWRAARVARDRVRQGEADVKPGYDYETIPARVIEVSGDQDRLAVQLVENIQRHDMRDEDIGRAVTRLRDDSGEPMTQADLARRLGVSIERIRDLLCAGSEEGRTVMARLGAGSWYDVRRFIALKNDPRDRNRRKICDAVIARIDSGEPFSRSMLRQEMEAYEARKRAENDVVRLAEIDRLQEEERKARDARREAEAAREKAEAERLQAIKRLREAERKSVEKRDIQAAIAEAETYAAEGDEAIERDFRSFNHDATLDEVEQQTSESGDEDLPPFEVRERLLKTRADRIKASLTPPARLPGESDAAYLVRLDQSDEFPISYAHKLGSPAYADFYNAFSASDPEQRLVTVSIDLPAHKAEILAGLLDGLIESDDLPTRGRRTVITGYDVERRIKALVEKL
ncbi:ParB N-terminal domain-containing protein [Acidiphilium sp. PM]|uniref:ParB/RepB/Spo0J family partition protein n=1 Tax=Acidiphilium sp. PM TaxID=1043206 RepID=UPI0002145665|nr:ParB N-terminal domain-containing protein [Acidiphilium sp. PM]EGO97015.1 ParB-like partition protein [Acidiphilium sp. PM]